MGTGWAEMASGVPSPGRAAGPACQMCCNECGEAIRALTAPSARVSASRWKEGRGKTGMSAGGLLIKAVRWQGRARGGGGDLPLTQLEKMRVRSTDKEPAVPTKAGRGEKLHSAPGCPALLQ